MKKLNFIFFLSFLLVSCVGQSQNQLKRYSVKSGIVEYKTTISGSIMGGKVSGSGTEELYFKNWGALELRKETSTQTTTIKMFGKENRQTSNKHTAKKLDNGESYSVDFDKKQIIASRDMAMDMIKSSQPNGDAEKVGKSLLESMGGKQVGNETYKGYKCEVWELLGGKQWTHKGVMLKMEMTVLGIKTLTEATSVKFDVSVPDEEFELPDFPIQKSESFMSNQEFQSGLSEVNEGSDVMQNLSFDEWKKMVIEGDPEMKKSSDKELRESYNLMLKMLKMRQDK